MFLSVPEIFTIKVQNYCSKSRCNLDVLFLNLTKSIRILGLISKITLPVCFLLPVWACSAEISKETLDRSRAE